MAIETIFQHWIAVQFIYPFLLIFTILFAILQKTKILGEDKKQIDAIVAFVIAFIFVTAIGPKDIVSNLILFLTVAIVIVFVILLLWGLVSGEKGLKFENAPKGLKWVIGIVIVIAVIIAVLWASGIEGSVLDLLFGQSWSGQFWTNFFFIAVVVIALAVVLKSKSD